MQGALNPLWHQRKIRDIYCLQSKRWVTGSNPTLKKREDDRSHWRWFDALGPKNDVKTEFLTMALVIAGIPVPHLFHAQWTLPCIEFLSPFPYKWLPCRLRKITPLVQSLRDRPLENLWGGWGGQSAKKIFAQGKIRRKKIHARQLTLKNNHATA